MSLDIPTSWVLTAAVRADGARYSGIERPPQYAYTELSHVPGAKEYLDARLKSSSDSDSESADDDKRESKGKKEVYVGSCHCKAIQFAVLCEPLDSIGITDCACTICLGVSLTSSFSRAILVFSILNPSTTYPS